VVEGVVWPEQTLTQLEGHDWGEPNFPSYVVTNGHRLRYKPLREFTAEDLRFMLGQQISLATLMPMALDVLELVDPFTGGDMNHGTLLYNALKVDSGSGRSTRGCGTV
jgi:CDI immunity proteins